MLLPTLGNNYRHVSFCVMEDACIFMQKGCIAMQVSMLFCYSTAIDGSSLQEVLLTCQVLITEFAIDLSRLARELQYTSFQVLRAKHTHSHTPYTGVFYLTGKA